MELTECTICAALAVVSIIFLLGLKQEAGENVYLREKKDDIDSSVSYLFLGATADQR